MRKGQRQVDNRPSVFEWFEQMEGRRSERSRRLSFLVLFREDGKPRYWLILTALVGAVVIGTGLGG